MIDMHRRRGAACLAPLCLACLAVLSSGPPAAGDGCRNPVIAQDFPDPDVVETGGTYYLYATNPNYDPTEVNVQRARSGDLEHWEVLADALPRLPDWAEAGNTWAPEVAARPDGDGYVLYFTARHRASGRPCIGAALSVSPEGPFTPVGPGPLICPLHQCGAIDASTFLDSDGRFYVLWKNDGNGCKFDTWIWIQEASGDGLHLQGEEHALIKQDQPWEDKLVEAPTLWKQAGRYYLFYSANAYHEPAYAIGYAIADQPTGPYRKAPGPFLGTQDDVPIIGPGGQDIVATGRDTWLVYHSWSPDMSERTVRIDPLHWEDGQPVVKPGC
jgi:beta-xylosidase